MKLCQCGCKLPVSPGRYWRRGHYWKGRGGELAMNWKGGGPTKGEVGSNRGRTYAPGHPWAIRAGTVYIPSEMAMGEMILGYCLLEPPGWTVFFLDKDRTNLVAGNMVICQNQAYVWLLRTMQKAWLACGHSGWRCCRLCKEWGPADNFRTDGSHKAGFGCRTK